MKMENILKWGIIPAVLLILSWMDIKKYMIPIWCVAGLFISTAVYSVTMGEGIKFCLFGCIPGIVILATAMITRGGVGMGDALVLIALGVGTGLSFIAGVLGIALITCGIFAALLLVVFKYKRNRRLPFVPFITGGYIICLLVRNI